MRIRDQAGIVSLTIPLLLLDNTCLCSRGPGLEPFVVTSLVQLLCRTTKLCWFEDDQFSRTVEDAKRLLEKGSQGGSTVRLYPV